jgi:hypothetical protein
MAHPYVQSMRNALQTSGALLAACLMTGCADGVISPEAGLPDLSTHQGRHRVLVIDTPSLQSGEYLRQSSALETVPAGLHERHVQIVTQTAKVFRVRLVGKDGGVKHVQSVPIDAPTLFALIDAMPMRRAEMSGR